MSTITADHRELMVKLHRAARLGERVGDRRFQSEVGIGRATFLVLAAVADDPSISQQRLAHRLSLTKGAVSRIVDQAARHGWLRADRSKASRRENALVLTADGESLVARGRTLQRAQDRTARQRLDPADVEAAIRVLTTICEELEREEATR